MFATWLYVSSSLLGSKPDIEIANIRRVAETRNLQLGITGVLIFSGKHFAQYLEGPAAELEMVKTSVCGDERHTGVVTLQAGPVELRRYGNWALAYPGQTDMVDRVLVYAAREHNPKELIGFMDEFIATLH